MTPAPAPASAPASASVAHQGVDPAGDTIDLADVARTIGHGWPVILGFTVLGILLAIGVLLWAPPKFAGNASVVLRSTDEGGGSVLSRLASGGDAASTLLGGAVKSPLETEIVVLASRSLGGRVVDSLDLQARVVSPRGFPPYRIVASLSLAPAFKTSRYKFERQGTGYLVDGAGFSRLVSPLSDIVLPVGSVRLLSSGLPPAFTLELSDRETAITRLEKNLTIDKAGGDVLRVSYRSGDSLSAAAVPNTLVAVYLDRRRTTDRGTNQRRVEFLTLKMDTVNQQLSSAEDQLRREREASGVFDPAAVGKVELDEAGTLRGHLTDLEVEQGALSLLVSRVTSGTIDARQLAAFPTFLKSPAINDLISQLSQVETQRYELLGTRTEQDPEVLALTQSAHNIENQLLPLARTYDASIVKQRTDVEGQLKGVQGTIAELPRAAQDNGRLQRDVLELGTIYGAMQAQLVDAKLAAIGEGGQVQPLDAAVPPEMVAFPTKLLTLAAGIGAGLLIGIIVALVLGAVGGVRDPDQTERLHGSLA